MKMTWVFLICLVFFQGCAEEPHDSTMGSPAPPGERSQNGGTSYFFSFSNHTESFKGALNIETPLKTDHKGWFRLEFWQENLEGEKLFSDLESEPVIQIRMKCCGSPAPDFRTEKLGKGLYKIAGLDLWAGEWLVVVKLGENVVFEQAIPVL